MNIIIEAVNFNAGKALETFIKNKVNKLFRQYDSIIRANVVLRKGESKNIENKLCEIRLVVPGYDHIVKKSTREYQQSVSQSVNVLQEILRRNKTRIVNRRQTISIL